MNGYARYNVIPTYGDLSVKSGGDNIYGNDPEGQRYTGLQPGQLVVFDPETGDTYDSTDISSADKVSIALAIDTDGDLVPDRLRYIAGEHIDLCRGIQDASVKAPDCGTAQVIDVFFDCTACNETYSFGVYLNDNFVRSQYEFNQDALYEYSIATECHSCDDCNPEHNCKEVACKLRDQINGNVQTSPFKLSHFPFKDLTDNYQPFRAARLFSNSYKYTLTLNDGTCEDCNYLDAIAKATIDGSDYTFTNAQNPADGTQTLPGQLKNIESQLNSELGDYGSAFIKQGSGKCCDYILEVNTCYTDFALKDDTDSTITPDGESATDPFQSFTVENDCPDCGEGDSSVTFNCGIRLFAEPVDVHELCECDFPPNRRIPQYFGRSIDVDFLGEDVDNIDRHVYEVTAQTLPTGFGLYWQNKEHRQHLGGEGLDYRNSQRIKGTVGLPDDLSRARHVLSKCHEQYCVYFFEVERPYRTGHLAAPYAGNKTATYVLIPTKDTTTRSSFESYIDEILSRSECPVSGTLSC